MVLRDKHVQLFKTARDLHRPPSEKTIFSIGCRGYYENPTSDLLAFFANPLEVHGLGDLILKTIFRLIHVSDFYSNACIELIFPPSREVFTDSSNRIDLLFQGPDWILLIENKIRHHANNPWADYEAHLSKLSTSKRKYLLLLSARPEDPPTGWHALTYTELVPAIKEDLRALPDESKQTKWHTFFLDFLLNLDNECGCGESLMNKERHELVQHNYSDILELKEMLEEYTTHVRETIADEIGRVLDDATDITCRSECWPDAKTAFRFWRTSTWPARANVLVVLERSGTFHLYTQYSGIPSEKASSLRSHHNQALSTNYSRIWEFKLGSFTSLDALVEDATKAALAIQAWYKP